MSFLRPHDLNEPTERAPLLAPSAPHSASAPATDIDAEAGPADTASTISSVSSKSQSVMVSKETVRDWIIGLSDGLTVPFALTAGLSSVGSSKLVVVAGLAELTSGAISMALGGFLSAQAEKDFYENAVQSTTHRLVVAGFDVAELEVTKLLGEYGISRPVAHEVSLQLHSSSLTPELLQNKEVTTPSGLVRLLLHLGQGLEPVSTERSFQSGLNIGLGYVLGGFVPLLPYFVLETTLAGLAASTVLTFVSLLLFEIIKHRATGGAPDARAYAWSALTTLAVGGAAAASSWLIVKWVEGPDAGM